MPRLSRPHSGVAGRAAAGRLREQPMSTYDWGLLGYALNEMRLYDYGKGLWRSESRSEVTGSRSEVTGSRSGHAVMVRYHAVKVIPEIMEFYICHAEKENIIFYRHNIVKFSV